MEYLIEELTGPTNPVDFVGRNDLIDKYAELLREFVRSNQTAQWIHLSGKPGIGKSSLLRKLRMMTEQERIATASIEVPISPVLAENFLTDIKLVTEEMSPQWRSFIQRKRNVDLAKVNLKDTSFEDIEDIVDQFFVDLDRVDKAMKEEKMRHGIFLDDLHKLQNYQFDHILKIWPLIAKRLRKDNYNMILVTTSIESSLDLLGLNDPDRDARENVLHLQLDQFDFSEAELMVRRKGKLVKSDREQAVQTSTRFPFDLSLRQLMMVKEVDPSNLTTDAITKTFSFESEEVKLLNSLAKNSVNFFKLQDYSQHHSDDVINTFRENMILSITQDGFFSFESTAMWELVSNVYKPIDPRTEVLLILNRLSDQASRGQLPSNRDIRIVRQNLIEIGENTLIYELSAQLTETAKAALDGKLIKTAWDLLELATFGLEKTKDFEKIGDLQENLAKGFGKVDHDYFSAKAFEKAGKFFKLADIDWRSITNYREAAQKFKKVAESTDVKTYHFAIRNILKHSITAYINADERTKAKRVLRDAKELLENYPNHLVFFDSLENKIEVA